MFQSLLPSQANGNQELHWGIEFALRYRILGAGMGVRAPLTCQALNMSMERSSPVSCANQHQSLSSVISVIYIFHYKSWDVYLPQVFGTALLYHYFSKITRSSYIHTFLSSWFTSFWSKDLNIFKAVGCPLLLLLTHLSP